jgi:hypothetical protein
MSYSDSKGHSYSGTAPKVSATITQFRGYAQALGTGFGQMDWRYFTLQMLYLVEYADYNSQSKLGNGVISFGSPLISGQCDSLGMKSGCLSSDSRHSMTYRGIEDILGNVFEWVDGIKIQDNQTSICYNPVDYGDSTKYSNLGYPNKNSSGWVTRLGYDATNPTIALPTEIGGVETTYMCDYYNQATGNHVLCVGGRFDYGGADGLWGFDADHSSGVSYFYVGARLLKY